MYVDRLLIQGTTDNHNNLHRFPYIGMCDMEVSS